MKTKSLIGLIVGVFCLSLFFVGCNSASKDLSGVIAGKNKELMDAYAKGDIPGILNMYTSGAKILPANSETIQGIESIQSFWENTVKMGIKKLEFEIINTENAGNITVEEGRYKLFVEGDILVDQGKYIVTWKNEGGEWKIDRDIWNTNNPARQRASLNDTVWIVTNYIKADKAAQFEEFNTKILLPAANEVLPEKAWTVRMLKPVNKEKAGILSYYYLMDPLDGSGGLRQYEVDFVLEAKYGKEKASEYLKTLMDCYAEKGSTTAVTTPLY